MSIIEVAKNAGVSKATVSRVINKVGNVSPETVRLVHQAMERLNYHPPQSRRGQAAARNASSRTGQRLSLQRLSMLALILPEMKIGLYAPLQHGFTESVDVSGFQVAARSNENNVYRQFDAIGQAIYGESAGIALVPVSSGDTPSYHVLLAQKAGIPVVLLYRDVRGVKAPAFIVPLEEVGQNMATMALECQHRRIAMLTSRNHTSTQLFLKGVRERLAEAGCELPDSLFFSLNSSTMRVGGNQQTLVDSYIDRLLEMPKKERPTALLTGNTRFAEILWLKLLERGCRVPDDFSILTLGSKGDEGGVRDHFAAVTFDAEGIGRQAAKVLTEMINHERDIDDNEKVEIELDTSHGKTLGTPS